MGETVLSTEALTSVVALEPHRITVEAGMPVETLQGILSHAGAWFPPAPTYTGAFAGGIVATNAAGASTFKYGSVRQWVEALSIVLADGSPITISRGERIAADGQLVIPTAGGQRIVPIPRYRMPAVVKHSAGYYAAPDMDAVDLFIGSEGTLGVITAVTFRILSPAPAVAWALVPVGSEDQAIAIVAALRRASIHTRQTSEPDGLDVAAIEHMDRRSVEILREDGADRRHDVTIPDGCELVLLVQLELPPGLTDADGYEQIQSVQSGRPIGPLGRFCRLLVEHDAFDDTEIALPDDRQRAARFVAIREAVPEGVNARVGRAQRDVDSRIAKTAADMIVPFEAFRDMLEIYRTGFRKRRLDFAVWGHISDGNVHPNVLPASYEDMERGKEAILDFGRDVVRLGGCPLAEHGVGRNPIKQRLLRDMYGEAGLDEMRAVKRALDPEWKLAPGVIFPSPA